MCPDISKQQENFSENMGQLRESHAKGEARLSRLEAAFVNLYNTVTEIGKAQKELTEKVSELAESQTHTDPHNSRRRACRSARSK